MDTDDHVRPSSTEDRCKFSSDWQEGGVAEAPIMSPITSPIMSPITSPIMLRGDLGDLFFLLDDILFKRSRGGGVSEAPDISIPVNAGFGVDCGEDNGELERSRDLLHSSFGGSRRCKGAFDLLYGLR